MSSLSGRSAPRFELRFEPFSAWKCTLAFPCDEKGAIDLDVLTDEMRLSYLAARALMGHTYAAPVVACPLPAH